MSWFAASEVVGGGIEWFYGYVTQTWQARQDRKARSGTIEREAVEAKRELVIEHEPIRIEPAVVKIPKSPKVQKEKQESLFTELPDSPIPPLKLLDEAETTGELISAESL